MLFIHCLKYFCIFPSLIPIFMLRYMYEKKNSFQIRLPGNLSYLNSSYLCIIFYFYINKFHFPSFQNIKF